MARKPHPRFGGVQLASDATCSPLSAFPIRKKFGQESQQGCVPRRACVRHRFPDANRNVVRREGQGVALGSSQIAGTVAIADQGGRNGT